MHFLNYILQYFMILIIIINHYNLTDLFDDTLLFELQIIKENSKIYFLNQKFQKVFFEKINFTLFVLNFISNEAQKILFLFYNIED